jgi:hypothetical protein
MKIKNFRLRNRERFYFFQRWLRLSVFEQKPNSPKELNLFPSGRSPNVFPSEASKDRKNLNRGENLLFMLRRSLIRFRNVIKGFGKKNYFLKEGRTLGRNAKLPSPQPFSPPALGPDIQTSLARLTTLTKYKANGWDPLDLAGARKKSAHSKRR